MKKLSRKLAMTAIRLAVMLSGTACILCMMLFTSSLYGMITCACLGAGVLVLVDNTIEANQ